MEPHLYDVRITLAGLVEDMPRDSIEQIHERHRMRMSLGLSVETIPVYGDSPVPYDVLRTGEWDAEWKVFVQAWTADAAHDHAMRRVQEDPAYVPGMFERARSVKFEVDRHDW